MKAVKQTYQVKLWALVGPFICLFSLFVLSINTSQVPILLSLSLFIGMPVCWKWNLWGWGAMSAFLLAGMAYIYPNIPLETRFWFIGMGASIILSLLITALSFKEVEVLIESIGLESRSRLDNLWKLDEKKKAVEVNSVKKEEQIRELQIKVRSFQKLVDLSTEGILQTRSNDEKTFEELRQVKEQNALLQQRLEKVIQDPPMEAKWRQLREQFKEKSRILSETRKELFLSNEKFLLLQREYDELRHYSLGEVEEALVKHLLRIVKEKDEEEEIHQQEIDALQAIVTRMVIEQEENKCVI